CFEVPSGIANKVDSILAAFLSQIGRLGGFTGFGVYFHNPQLLLAKVCAAWFQSPLNLGVDVWYRGRNYSWGLRGLIRAGKTLIKGCEWKVGNGTSRSFNSALLMKQVWRLFHNPQLLLAKVCAAWFQSPLNLGVDVWYRGRNYSWGLRGLIRAGKTLIKGCGWKAKDWKISHFICPSGSEWNLARLNSTYVHTDATLIARHRIRGLIPQTVILVDGSWNKRTHRLGMAQSALHAELNACLGGLQWALIRSLRAVTIYTDYVAVVRCLQRNQDSDFTVHWTLARIHHLSSILSGVPFSRWIGW
uniref:RNase H type-1 domain-containing protein n=1 Tax=Chenopodium quinoa TaxID=63459 RepID=A0A803NC98_CHEQI